MVFGENTNHGKIYSPDRSKYPFIAEPKAELKDIVNSWIGS
jgi:hypothetical protein